MDARTLRIAVLACSIPWAACATNKGSTPRPVATEPLTDKTVAAPKPVFACDDQGADWPMFQRTSMRDGAVVAAPIKKPEIAWSREIGIASWLDNPIIAGGRVFAPSSGQVWNRPDGSDGLYAFDLDTGEPLWFAATAGDANGVAYENCRVFVGSDGGSVTALDARNGDVLWTSEFGAKMYSNPLPLGDRVLVGGEGGIFAALDASTGGVLWRRELGGSVRGGAAADGEHVYVTTDDARVSALRIADGRGVWTTDFATPTIVSVYSAPTLARGHLYVAYVRDTYYETPAMRMLDPATGNILWDAKNPNDFSGGWGNIRSSPAVYDGKLFWGEAYSNRIVGIDGSTGDIASSVATGTCMFAHWPSPAVAQNVVYLPRHDGSLYAYDAENGGIAWSLYLGAAKELTRPIPPQNHDDVIGGCLWEPPFGKPVYASPAVAQDGSVVVATGDGWLHVVREASE